MCSSLSCVRHVALGCAVGAPLTSLLYISQGSVAICGHVLAMSRSRPCRRGHVYAMKCICSAMKRIPDCHEDDPYSLPICHEVPCGETLLTLESTCPTLHTHRRRRRLRHHHHLSLRPPATFRSCLGHVTSRQCRGPMLHWRAGEEDERSANMVTAVRAPLPRLRERHDG